MIYDCKNVWKCSPHMQNALVSSSKHGRPGYTAGMALSNLWQKPMRRFGFANYKNKAMIQSACLVPHGNACKSPFHCGWSAHGSAADLWTNSKWCRCPSATGLLVLIPSWNWDCKRFEGSFYLEPFLEDDRALHELNQIVKRHMTQCGTSSKFSKALQQKVGVKWVEIGLHYGVVLARFVAFGQREEW